MAVYVLEIILLSFKVRRRCLSSSLAIAEGGVKACIGACVTVND